MDCGAVVICELVETIPTLQNPLGENKDEGRIRLLSESIMYETPLIWTLKSAYG